MTGGLLKPAFELSSPWIQALEGKGSKSPHNESRVVWATRPIDFHSTTHALADTAADFKARYKMSLADAFAAALAKEKKAELVTGDPEFGPLDQEIEIHWLK